MQLKHAGVPYRFYGNPTRDAVDADDSPGANCEQSDAPFPNHPPRFSDNEEKAGFPFPGNPARIKTEVAYLAIR